MADTLESLEIKVKHSASGADVEINSLAKAIGNLQKELSGLSVESMKGLVNSFKASAEALKGAKTGQLTKFAEAMADVAASAEMLGDNSEAIGKLAEAMTAVSGVKVYAGAFNSLATGVKNVGEASKTLTSESLENLEKMVTTLSKLQGVDLQGLGSAMSAVGRNAGSTKAETPIVPVSVGLQEIISTASAVDVLEAKLESLKIAMEEAFAAGDADKAYALRGQILQTEAALEKARGAANKTEKETNRLADAMKRLKDSVTRANGPLARFFSSLKRIAFYRMIRSVIKEITEAFSEGLKNAYLFSAGLTTISGHRFAAAMDTMNSKATQMKNQLGSAFIGLLTALEPVIVRLVDLVIKLADAMSQFISAFTGTTYLRAATVSDKFADNMASGAKSAKEWKNQLLGFDVINRLEEPSNGGGGGLSPTEMFGGEEAEISEFWKKWAERIKRLIPTLEDLKELVKQIGLLFLAWKIGSAFGTSLTQSIGLALTLYSVFRLVSDIIRTLDEGLTWDNLTRLLVDIAALALGAYLAFGKIGAGIALVVGGAALLVTAFNDMEKNGMNLINTLGMIAGLFAAGLGLSILTHSFIPLAVAALASLVVWLVYAFDEGEDFTKGIRKAFDGLGKFFKNIFKGDVDAAMKGLREAWDGVKQASGAVTRAVQKAWQALLTWIGDKLGPGWKKFFEETAASVGRWFENIKTGLTGVITFIRGVITGDWKLVWQGLLDILKGIVFNMLELFGSITKGIGTVIDKIKDLLGADKQLKAGDNVFNDYATGNLGKKTGTGNPFMDYASGIPGYATGGFPEPGLFYANERGPELVGTINGRTAVANQDQIVAAVSQGVANAVASVMGNGSERPLNVRVYLDSREIKTGQRNYSRAMGV